MGTTCSETYQPLSLDHSLISWSVYEEASCRSLLRGAKEYKPLTTLAAELKEYLSQFTQKSSFWNDPQQRPRMLKMLRRTFLDWLMRSSQWLRTLLFSENLLASPPVSPTVLNGYMLRWLQGALPDTPQFIFLFMFMLILWWTGHQQGKRKRNRSHKRLCKYPKNWETLGLIWASQLQSQAAFPANIY